MSTTLIIGCGRVGAMVATRLVERGGQVTIVDLDAENFRRLTDRPGLQMLVANGTSDEDLVRVGVKQADAVLALTASDTVNALVGQSAQMTFGVARVVCRINDPVRRDMYESMGLAVVSPPQVITDLVLEAMER